MEEYVEINRKAYDKLSHQYNERWREQVSHQKAILEPFEKKLQKDFENPIKILDVGCGVGLDCHIFSSHGFQSCGIDISSEMIEYAKQNVPDGVFKTSNFLEYSGGKFNGIIMDAFLHLFPLEDVPIVLNKVKKFLVTGGYGLICTTKCNKSTEGYFEKTDYRGGVKRFRKFWTEHELKNIIVQSELEIVDFYIDHNEYSDKVWMNVIFRLEDG